MVLKPIKYNWIQFQSFSENFLERNLGDETEGRRSHGENFLRPREEEFVVRPIRGRSRPAQIDQGQIIIVINELEESCHASG